MEYEVFGVMLQLGYYHSTLPLYLNRAARSLGKVTMSWRDIDIGNIDFCQSLANCPDLIKVALLRADFALLSATQMILGRYYSVPQLKRKILHTIGMNFSKLEPNFRKRCLRGQIDPYLTQLDPDAYFYEKLFVCCGAFQSNEIAALERYVLYLKLADPVENGKELAFARFGRIRTVPRLSVEWFYKNWPLFLFPVAVGAMQVGNLELFQLVASLSTRMDLDKLLCLTIGKPASVEWLLNNSVKTLDSVAVVSEQGQRDAVLAVLNNGKLNNWKRGSQIRVLKMLGERTKWQGAPMLRAFDEYDCCASQDGLGLQIKWLREAGCPWDLRRFYEEPQNYVDLLPSLKKLGLSFDAATLRDLCKRAPLKPNLWMPALSIARLHKTFPSYLRIDEKTLKLLPCCAARLGAAQLNKALEEVPCDDGVLWECAAKSRCYSALEYLRNRKHPWRSKQVSDWSELCRFIDWRWLHDAGSPCRVRH